MSPSWVVREGERIWEELEEGKSIAWKNTTHCFIKIKVGGISLQEFHPQDKKGDEGQQSVAGLECPHRPSKGGHSSI